MSGALRWLSVSELTLSQIPPGALKVDMRLHGHMLAQHQDQTEADSYTSRLLHSQGIIACRLLAVMAGKRMTAFRVLYQSKQKVHAQMMHYLMLDNRFLQAQAMSTWWQ